MNILFISRLSGNMWSGLNNSIPNQILAQNKIDNVMWYNLNYIKRQEWIKLDCKNFDDFPTGRLLHLPVPFNNPDIAIIEGVYVYPFNKIIYDLQKLCIPYILIPRSQLTIQAQHRKAIKKKIGNAVYFRKMIKHAAAIQYLTIQEKKDSEILNWNKNSFIIPNGIYIPNANIDNIKKEKESIIILYIGRYEIYQKGLDLLMNACIFLRDKLIESNCKIKLYGHDEEKTKSKIEYIIKSNELQKLIYVKDAVLEREKEHILFNSNIFIMTSRFEGLPMAMLEALSYGLPCFATKGTNMADVIAEYDAGWTAENTVEDITAQMSIMLDEIKNKNILKKKSENAKMLASNYDWDSLAKKAHEIYTSFLS